MQNITLRSLDLKDLHHVADIHIRAFTDSALTGLGREAIRRYYEWQLVGPHDVLAQGAFLETGQMAGFCFSGVFRGALSGFLHRNRLYLTGRVLTHPWLLVNSLFVDRVRLALRLLRPGLKFVPASTPARRSYGILAISVDPTLQGKGVGRALMAGAEEAARAALFGQMHLTVSPKNHQAVRFYESLGWQRVSENGQPWQGSMVKVFQVEG